MKKIYLVRHGEKVKTVGDPPLSDIGVQQAEKAGKYLSKFPINAIIASPLKRTQETAQHISDHTGIPFVIDKRLRERQNWGDAEGQSMDDFLREWERASEDRDFKPLSGDSSRKAGERMEEIIREVTKNSQKNIVLVAHGGIITDFLRNAFEEHELDATYKEFSKLRDLAVKECSITTLSVEDGKYHIEKIADIEHLSL